MTVTVYAEMNGGSYAEVIAKFSSEELYHECSEILEAFAKKHNFDYITESINEEEEL